MRSEINNDAPFSAGIRVYFQERLRHRLYDLILKEMDHYRSTGRTQAELAHRLQKRPEQISRWLSGPGNLTLDTTSDLLLGLSGAELAMSLDYPAARPQNPSRIPADLAAGQDKKRTRTVYQTVVTAVSTHFEITLDDNTVSVISVVSPDVPAYAELA